MAGVAIVGSEIVAGVSAAAARPVQAMLNRSKYVEKPKE